MGMVAGFGSFAASKVIRTCERIPAAGQLLKIFKRAQVVLKDATWSTVGSSMGTPHHQAAVCAAPRVVRS